MAGSWPQQDFPHLADSDYSETSPSTRRYNCTAWAARDSLRWWWPDPHGLAYWPPNAPREVTITAFIIAYGTLGYVPCSDGSLEDGFEKIVIYAVKDAMTGQYIPTHAALQLANGDWTSKIGGFEDISHKSIDCLNGPRYGAAVQFLKKISN